MLGEVVREQVDLAAERPGDAGAFSFHVDAVPVSHFDF
jgi:hypothetical protein